MSITDTLQAIAAFNFLLIAGLIFSKERKITSAASLFAFFLLAKGITLSSNLVFVHAQTLSSSTVSTAQLANSFLFFYAPFLYFFALKLNKQNTKRWPHFGLFIAYLLFNIIVVFQYYTANASLAAVVNFIAPSIIYIYYLQAISYTFLAYKLVNTKDRKSLFKTQFRSVLLLFFLVWTFFFGEFIAAHFFQNNLAADALKLAGIVLLLALANISIYLIIRHPQEHLFSPQTVDQKNKLNKFITPSNYERLCALIRQEELYKKADLKLIELAHQLGLSDRNTSLLIKTYHGGNFYDFINSFRIELAKQLLQDAQRPKTVLEILYESGFNSKSVFNTAFKKQEGLTPTAYRKQQAHSFG